MATVLAIGDVTGSTTITLTVTADQPAGSVVHLIQAAVGGDTVPPDPAALPTDSRSGSWEDSNYAGFHNPILGAISNGTAGIKLQLGNTAVRVSGDPLQAGDTVDATWIADTPSLLTIAAVLVAFTEMNLTAVGQYNGGTTPSDDVGVYYSNGDTVIGGNDLSWSGDLGASFMPYPKASCKMLAACAASVPAVGPLASGWTPAVGSLVVEHQSADGSLSLGVHLASAAALTAIEPGGTWASGSGSLLASNYQFAEGPSGFRGWQRF